MISYVSPEVTSREQRAKFKRWWRLTICAALAGAYISAVLGVLPLTPDRTWYFGHHPQWILSVDAAGLTLGPNYSAHLILGRAPLAIIELLFISYPAWLAERMLIQRPK